MAKIICSIQDKKMNRSLKNMAAKIKKTLYTLLDNAVYGKKVENLKEWFT